MSRQKNHTANTVPFRTRITLINHSYLCEHALSAMAMSKTFRSLLRYSPWALTEVSKFIAADEGGFETSQTPNIGP